MQDIIRFVIVQSHFNSCQFLTHFVAMINQVIATFRKHLKAVSREAILVVFTAVLSWALMLAQPAKAQELPSLNINGNQVTVSGLSSGAFMAVQMHVAFSDRIQGAGVVAGGPYYCAEGDLTKALTTCMRPTTMPMAMPEPEPMSMPMPVLSEPPDGRELAAVAQRFANEGHIDPTSNLIDDSVYLFSGTMDYTVYTSVTDAIGDFYRTLGVPSNKIEYIKSIPAGHAFITTDYGRQCFLSLSPYINDCDYDQAGNILKHLLGQLNPPSATLSGQFVEFYQDEFVENPNAQGMAHKGYVYIPKACADGEACKLHIALHGGLQSYEKIGDEYYAHTGYNEWADSNNIVVLYPQAHAIMSTNSGGNWDWWGYTNSEYAFKTGSQTSAIMKMVDKLASG